MKFAKICIILLFLIISIGAVSATQEINNETISTDNPIEQGDSGLNDDSTLPESTQNSENDINDTFTDFSKDMNKSVDVMNVTHDYKFTNKTDKGPILIDRDNFTIEGNNHVIDGAKQTTIFQIKAANITINNLILINGYCKLGGLLEAGGGGAITSSKSLTLNNVTFINNTANYYGGDILASGKLDCFDCKFIDSHSVNGNSICSGGSILNIQHCTFTSKYSSKWSTVYAEGSEVIINDCLFNNISSDYAPAIFVRSGDALINNTKFNNLKAYKTAGAVGTKECDLTIIQNCLFTNTTSFKNGGAVFSDPLGGGHNYEAIVYLINSTFINTSSSFGGAYVQLSGNLILKDSSFTNCYSDFGGGAVYTSAADANITNCKFNSNKVASYSNYPTYGGAIYFDYATLNLINSEFNSNEAPIGSAIFIYDSEYHLDNITLNNNKNAIYTYFDNVSSTIGKIYGNDKISQNDLNNTLYPSLVVGQGIILNLTANNTNLTLPEKFDLRDIGWVTPVRDQGSMGSCWTFGTLDALESALVKSTGISYYLSENNVQDVMLIYSRYGDFIAEGGAQENGAAYIVNWFGVFPQDYDTYDELGKISPLIHANQTIHVQDYVFIDRNMSNPGDPLIKEAILKYGVLCIVYDATQANPKDYNFYSNSSTSADHAVGLVGWNDNYPKENFLNQPPGDGAWIIKNSWGTEWGEEGYGYISYYDTSFCPTNNLIDQAIGYIIENTLPYNKNYQYDFSGIDDFMTYDTTDKLYGSQITNVNVFISEDDDLLAAVGTYFNQSGLDYTVKIAVNDVVVYTQNGISPYRGYHSIKLNKYVPIKKGDKFSIYVTSKALGVSAPARVYCQSGVTFTDYNGTWTDLYETYGSVACIKAYTLKDDTVLTGNKNIAVDYSADEYFSVKVISGDGHEIAGASVNFNIDGKTSTVKTDASGIAKIKIAQLPKKYIITTTYNGKSVKNTVTVNQVLTAYKVTVKKTAKKFSLKAKLKINGKLIKGKTITFKFNGKTYKVKTNAKGIAQKTLNKKVIKKLKKGKKYTLKATYIKDTVKTTVKVK